MNLVSSWVISGFNNNDIDRLISLSMPYVTPSTIHINTHRWETTLIHTLHIQVSFPLYLT